MAGMYFEEFNPGTVIDHPIRRTVTEMDNTLFSALTYNVAPLHIDAEYSKNTIFGQRIVNSMFMLALLTGVTVIDTTIGTTLGNLGMTDVNFPKPVFHGDTIHVRTEVLSKRESKKRADSGIVMLKHVAYNQRDEVVAECTRAALMLKREYAVSSTAQA
jgi:acyl dehydratase